MTQLKQYIFFKLDHINISIFLCLLLTISFTACSDSFIEQNDPFVEEDDFFILISGSLSQGQTLAQAMRSKGINNREAYNALNELNKVYNLRRCLPQDSFNVIIDTLDVIQHLSFHPIRDRVTSYSVVRDTSGVFTTSIDTLKTEIVLRKAEGIISSSLYESMRELREGPHLIVKFAEVFQWDVDFFIDPRQGDRFSLVYEQYMLNDEFVQYGNILVAEYQGRNYHKRAYRYESHDGGVGYYDSDGISFRKAFLRSPLNYTRITSRFSTSRRHPVLKIVRPHNGVDYGAPTGTPVVAASNGVVTHVGWKGGHPTVNGMSGGYGMTVMIRHSNGYETLYGHLSRYGEGIRKGVRVNQNQVIGYVGQTGLATGPHLHYTVYLNGVAIDPLGMNNKPSPPVPNEELEMFRLLTKDYDDLIRNSMEFFQNMVLH